MQKTKNKKNADVVSNELNVASDVSEESTLILDDEEESAESYEGAIFRLKDFDGPLEMICQMIRKLKLSFLEVKILDLTEQYLEYMHQIAELDMEKAAEFIAMAAWLLEIKSKSLLPRPQDLEEALKEEREFRHRVGEYMLFQEASKKMREIESVDIHYRAPEEAAFEPRYMVKDMDISGLIGALRKMFARMGEKAAIIKEKHIQKDRFTVEEKIAHIKDILIEKDTHSFFGLFDSNYSKGEIITTFCAILELLKAQIISSVQDQMFGDIVITKNQDGNFSLDMTDIDYS